VIVCVERPAEAAWTVSQSGRLGLGRAHPPATGTWRESSRYSELHRKRNISAVWGQSLIGRWFAIFNIVCCGCCKVMVEPNAKDGSRRIGDTSPVPTNPLLRAYHFIVSVSLSVSPFPAELFIGDLCQLHVCNFDPCAFLVGKSWICNC